MFGFHDGGTMNSMEDIMKFLDDDNILTDWICEERRDMKTQSAGFEIDFPLLAILLLLFTLAIFLFWKKKSLNIFFCESSKNSKFYCFFCE